MDAKFSPRVRDILTYSHEEALRLGNNYIGLEHLFLGMVRDGEGKALQILKYFGVDLEVFRRRIEEAIKSTDKPDKVLTNIPLIKQTERALKFTYIIAKEYKSDLIKTEHLLLAILRDKNNLITQNLEREGVDFMTYKNELTFMYTGEEKIDLSERPTSEFSGEAQDEGEVRPAGGARKWQK